jgi:hypothetical protein
MRDRIVWECTKLTTRKGDQPTRIMLATPAGHYLLALQANTMSGKIAGVLTGKRTASVCG